MITLCYITMIFEILTKLNKVYLNSYSNIWIYILTCLGKHGLEIQYLRIASTVKIFCFRYID
jgi:hypothetical protein